MPNELDFVAFAIARFALTYLLHSTVLLGGTWLVLRATRLRSWTLRERIWKLAVILPLMTAAIPLPASWSRLPARVNMERLMPGVPATESNVARIEAPQGPPIVAVRLSEDQARTLGLGEAARAPEPILAPAPEPQLPGIASSTELRPTSAGPGETEPTGADRAAVAVTVICYTVLTFFILGTLHVIRRSVVFARSLRDCRPIRDDA